MGAFVKLSMVWIVLVVSIGVINAMAGAGPYIVDMAGHLMVVVGLPAATAMGLWVLYRIVIGTQRVRLETAERTRRIRLEEEREELRFEKMRIANLQAKQNLRLVQFAEGVPPLAYSTVASGALTQQAFDIAARKIDAGRTHPNAPRTITYRPQPLPPQTVVDPPYTEPFAVPTFREIYNSGGFSNKGKILLGYDSNGNKSLTSLNKFYSTIISGASNKGKSSLFRYCLLQHVMQAPGGIDILMCDPHYLAGDDSLAYSLKPLQHMFAAEVASSEEKILEYAQYAESVGRSRMAGDRDRKPLMLIIDEVSLLMDGSDIEESLGHCLKVIGREFRKVGVMAVIIGQQFGSNVMATGSRNSFTRVLSCPNIRDNIGRMIPSKAAKQTEMLEVGQFVDFEVGGGMHQVLRFPDTTAQDVAFVAASTSGFQAASTARQIAENSTLEGGWKEAESGLEGVPEVASLREKRAKQMFFDERKSESAIIAELWGCKGGRRFAQCQEELRKLLKGK